MARALLIVGAALLALIAPADWLVYYQIEHAPCDGVYAVDDSPDGHYRVVVYRCGKRAIGPFFPGQGSDVPGEIRLIDRRLNWTLAIERIDMVQDYVRPTWTDDEVDLMLIVRWHLPPAPD